MTTLAGGALPIPEQVIVGTGSYVVPVDRYGFLSMSAASAGAGAGYETSFNEGGASGGGGAAVATNYQWVSEGTSLTSQTSNPSGTTSGTSNAARFTSGYARILLNGARACSSVNVASASSTKRNSTANACKAQTSHYSEISWSISLYRIPKGNLPIGAAEGE